MTFDYADTAELAVEALTEFGAPVVRRVTTAPVYSPATGAASAVQSDLARVGAVFDYGAGQTQVRGTLIQGGDKRLLLDASGEVLPTDQYVINGVVYSVVSIGEVNPAGTPVLFDIHVRT